MKRDRHRFSSRLSDAAWESLERFSQKWECENLSEALEKILVRWRYLDDLGFTQQQITEELACILRIQHEGLYYCMFSAPRNVNLSRRLLETLQVCAVCKKRRLGLTEKTLLSPTTAKGGIFIPQTEPQTETRADTIHDPTKNHAGMKYCNNGGLWVYPNKCEMCRTKTYPQYDNCQKQKAV
jgi:hypothetical protein